MNRDPYLYDGTGVLRNKFGVSDPSAAHDLETRLAYQRLVELAAAPVAGSFDLRHLQAIHAYVYQDLWEWAGQIRTVDTGTTNTGLAHCRPEFIEAHAHLVFGAIAADRYLVGISDVDTFTGRLAYHWGEMTALHPFRDGNTRSQRVFVDQLAKHAGWVIDWSAVNGQVEAFIHARLVAHAGDHGVLHDLLTSVTAPASGDEQGSQHVLDGLDP